MGATPTVPQAAKPQLVRLGLGSLAVVLAVASIAYGLAAARVPQHRAALEDLIRHETGLEVGFSELTVRWGWYGPEAVLHDVELTEPHGEGVRLRAPRLVAALDLWRMARSGRLEARRITLHDPDIDLAAVGAHASVAGRSYADGPRLGTRVLSSWRGGQVDVEGGTLRTTLPGGTVPARFGIRHAQLRRVAGEWHADAVVLLPEALGTGAHLTLQLHGDPALPQGASGTLGFEGRRLEFAGWRTLAGQTPFARYLPQAGSGNLELRATFAHGQLSLLSGRVRAEGLRWHAPAATAATLGLQRLRGNWQLARAGAHWHLSVDALELGATGETAIPTAAVDVDVAADGAWARGRAQRTPLAALAALARWFAPQVPLGEVTLGGQARELTFDWSARRAAGQRLTAAAALEDITLAAASGAVALTGLSARLAGTDTTLLADVQADAAHLTVSREPSGALERLEVAAHLTADTAGGGWQLSTSDLRVRQAGMTLTASGAIGAAAPQARPLINARLALRDADVAVLASLLGPRALAAIGAAAPHLTSGHIESADFSWHGPLDDRPGSAPGAQFTGTVMLRDASLVAGEGWPDMFGIGARLEWRGSRVHADIEQAQSGGFQLAFASADWDARSGHAAHFAARVAGSAAEALAWLRSHPQVAGWAPGVADIDVQGATLLDLDVTVPAAAAEPAAALRPLVRVAALLDDAVLRPVSGLPAITHVHGALVFAGEHLERSTLSGEWLGGPVSLGVGEYRENGQTALAISGHGLMGAREALQAAGGSAHEVPLAGNAEWSALLTFLPGAASAHARWRLHANSSLVGVASRLPDPFAKVANAALPAHLELQAGSDVGQLRVSLGERLAAVAALTRRGDTWRIERGAVRLAGGAPVLPAEAALLLDGRVSRLDLAACLALWRQAGADAALPELKARLTATQLQAGAHSYPDASLTATAAGGAGTLQVQSAALSVAARWPALIDAAHPATVRLVSFNIASAADTALAPQLAAVLAPAMQLQIEELRWQDRALGSFAALLSSRGEVLEASGLQLSGVSGETHASMYCRPAACEAKFSLDSADAAGTLAAFGRRPQINARHANLEGELRWSPQADAPLATLDGHLHMQLEEGLARVASDSDGAPFALLAVPALLAGMSADAADQSAPGLRFARLAADYELRDGGAATANLHFDGDAEILVRGRVGLIAGDYDEQAWILRGEDRLPAAVRRLGPTPRVAAAWLSLRELLGGGTDRARTALRLRGTWNDPIVTPAE